MAHISYLLIILTLSFPSIFGAEEGKATFPVSLQKKEVEKVTTQILPQKKITTKPLQKKRKVTVHNGIAKKDLGYYKYWMTHYPSEFNLHVNGKKLDSKEQIIVDESRLNVMYSYEWHSPLGRVKKSKTLVYDIGHKTEKVDLSFTSWKEDEPRIKAPGCSLITITEVEEANTIPKEQVKQFMAQAGQNK